MSAILSGIVADMADMGQQSKARAERRAERLGRDLPDSVPYLLKRDDQEFIEGLLSTMGIEGDLAGREFVLQVHEQQRTVAFDEEGRMITSEKINA